METGVFCLESLVERVKNRLAELEPPGVSRSPDPPPADEPVLELADEESAEEAVEVDSDSLNTTIRETLREQLRAFRTSVTGRVD